MNEDRFTEATADYALGLLEGGELEEFERHLAAGCAACERELAAMDAVGDALAYSVPPAAPAPALRERVLGAVEADLAAAETAAALPPLAPAAAPAAAPAPSLVDGSAAGQPLYRGQPTVAPTYAPAPVEWPPRRDVVSEAKPSVLSRIAPGLALLGLVAAGLAGYLAVRANGQAAHLRADLERVQSENLALTRVIEVVQSDRLRLVPLAASAEAPAGTGRVLWSPESRRAVLHASGLPRPPAGRDYQLWVIEGRTSRSEGVFPVDAQGRATHVLPEVPAPGEVDAFSVTLEPAGGAPRPSGATVLSGAVSAAR